MLTHVCSHVCSCHEAHVTVLGIGPHLQTTGVLKGLLHTVWPGTSWIPGELPASASLAGQGCAGITVLPCTAFSSSGIHSPEPCRTGALPSEPQPRPCFLLPTLLSPPYQTLTLWSFLGYRADREVQKKRYKSNHWQLFM